MTKKIWLVVWNMNFIFPFSWECHHLNWRTHIFQRGRSTTNQLNGLWKSQKQWDVSVVSKQWDFPMDFFQRSRLLAFPKAGRTVQIHRWEHQNEACLGAGWTSSLALMGTSFVLLDWLYLSFLVSRSVLSCLNQIYWCGFVWKCWVNIPNEIAIFHRDKDHENHWVQWGTQHFQTHIHVIICSWSELWSRALESKFFQSFKAPKIFHEWRCPPPPLD